MWVIARYDTEKTPFDYGHPGSGARRIVAEINLDFFDFCADESDPAAKPASSGRKRKQPPESDTDDDGSHSSRSSDGIPDTATRDGMGLPRSVSVTGHGRRSRRTTREKKHRSQRRRTDHYDDSDGGDNGDSSGDDGDSSGDDSGGDDSGDADNGSSGDRDSTKASLKSLLKQLNLHQKSNKLKTKQHTKKLEKDSALSLLTTNQKLLMKIVLAKHEEDTDLQHTIPFSNALKMIIKKKDTASITNQVRQFNKDWNTTVNMDLFLQFGPGGFTVFMMTPGFHTQLQAESVQMCDSRTGQAAGTRN